MAEILQKNNHKVREAEDNIHSPHPDSMHAHTPKVFETSSQVGEKRENLNIYVTSDLRERGIPVDRNSPSGRLNAPFQP